MRERCILARTTCRWLREYTDELEDDDDDNDDVDEDGRRMKRMNRLDIEAA
jgi:hypothetical protein